MSEQNRSLKDIIGEFAEKYIKDNIISDVNFIPENIEYSKLATLHNSMHSVGNHLIPQTAEQFYYRMIFEKHYNGLGTILPNFWMPKYIKCDDPSARTLDIYNQQTNNTSISVRI